MRTKMKSRGEISSRLLGYYACLWDFIVQSLFLKISGPQGGEILRNNLLILRKIIDDAFRYYSFFIHSGNVGNYEGLIQFFRGIAVHVA